MAYKKILFHSKAREKLLAGTRALADAVRVTLGPKSKSVLIDVAIDQGGCFETSKATTHQDPTFVVDDIIHYCVANMPGAAPLTATQALNNVTLPYTIKLANDGFVNALKSDPGFAEGLNIHAGRLYEKNVALEQKLEYSPIDSLIG